MWFDDKERIYEKKPYLSRFPVFDGVPNGLGTGRIRDQNEKPYAVIEDVQGKRVEGYLSLYPKKLP